MQIANGYTDAPSKLTTDSNEFPTYYRTSRFQRNVRSVNVSMSVLAGNALLFVFGGHGHS